MLPDSLLTNHKNARYTSECKIRQRKKTILVTNCYCMAAWILSDMKINSFGQIWNYQRRYISKFIIVRASYQNLRMSCLWSSSLCINATCFQFIVLEQTHTYFTNPLIQFDIKVNYDGKYSLMQKNGYTFTIVYSSKCVSVFLHQTLKTMII